MACEGTSVLHQVRFLNVGHGHRTNQRGSKPCDAPSIVCSTAVASCALATPSRVIKSETPPNDGRKHALLQHAAVILSLSYSLDICFAQEGWNKRKQSGCNHLPSWKGCHTELPTLLCLLHHNRKSWKRFGGDFGGEKQQQENRPHLTNDAKGVSSSGPGVSPASPSMVPFVRRLEMKKKCQRGRTSRQRL